MPIRRRLVSPRPIAAILLASGCAAQAPQTRPPAAVAPQPPAEPRQSQPPAGAPTPAPTPAPGEPTANPATPRLPWVNPARCLPQCAYDPGPRLVRINAQGERDARGKLQVLDEAEEPLRDLLAAARRAGHKLRVESAYRSYEAQVALFQRIQEAGRAARPGHSEHQLGAAIDLRLPTGVALAWLAQSAAEHGFALSYPAGKQRVTGYRPEPWHVRFVGQELAEELRRGGLTLEEHLRAHPERGESGSCGDCPHPSSRAACGEVSVAGACAGPVLSWCYDGALASVDCSSSGQRCAPQGGAVDAAAPGGPRPADCAPIPVPDETAAAPAD